MPDCRLSAVERKETYDVTATLRLLRLLVKYGEVMDDLFCMLTYADVCCRMLTYAAVCFRMLTYAKTR
jgi:hypothetical protein